MHFIIVASFATHRTTTSLRFPEAPSEQNCTDSAVCLKVVIKYCDELFANRLPGVDSVEIQSFPVYTKKKSRR